MLTTRRTLTLLGALFTLGCSPDPGPGPASDRGSPSTVSRDGEQRASPQDDEQTASRDASQPAPDPPATSPAQAPRDATAPPDPDWGPTMEVDVLGESGAIAGSLGIEPVGRTGVRLVLTVSGLSPGEHGVNIHARARCESPGFFTAGGHFDPAGSRHGKADEDEVLDDPDHHAGDMLNQQAGADGTLEVVVINRSVSLIDGRNRLLDEDGASLIVYARGDDYETQPSGAAGRRVACAEIDERAGDT